MSAASEIERMRHDSELKELRSRVDYLEAQRLRDNDVRDAREKALAASLTEIREILERRNERH
jgi:hypothetical protein